MASCLAISSRGICECFTAYGAGLGADEDSTDCVPILKLFLTECETNKKKSESTAQS